MSAATVNLPVPEYALRSLFLSFAKELEKLDALAQTAFHHIGAADHLAHDRCDFAGTEIEALIKHFERIEDLLVGQMRIVQRCDLNAVFVHQFRIVRVQPAVFDRLLVEKRAGVGRRQRDLNRVGIDPICEADRLFDRFRGLAGQSENERAVDGDSEVVAVLRELLCDFDAHALLMLYKIC